MKDNMSSLLLQSLGFAAAALCCLRSASSQSVPDITLGTGKVTLSRITFDPPLDAKVEPSGSVKVTFTCSNDTGVELFVYVAPLDSDGAKVSGYSPVKLAPGTSESTTQLNFGWSLVESSGELALFTEYDESTKKYSVVQGTAERKLVSRLREITQFEFGIYDAAQKIKDSKKHVGSFVELPEADLETRPSRVPAVNFQNVALVKSNIEKSTIALLEPVIMYKGVAVNVNQKTIKANGETKISPSTETFQITVVNDQKRTDVAIDSVRAWAIDGTELAPDLLLKRLIKPTRVLVIPPNATTPIAIPKYYRPVLAQDLILMRIVNAENKR